MKRAAAFVLAGVLLVSGILCAQNPKKADDAGKPLAAGKFRVTPIDLFPGDLRRLQPHLEIEGACFKIEYNGPKLQAQVITEIWEGGVGKVAGMSGAVFEGQTASEASISDKKTSDAARQAGLYVISHFEQSLGGVGRSGQTTFPKTFPKNANGSGTRGVYEVTEFAPEKEIALWCIVRTSGAIQSSAPIDSLVKSVDFAIVLKIVPTIKI
jgi:hypothetical protein